MKVEIRRDKHLTGRVQKFLNQPAGTLLSDDPGTEGMMCCLGFVCKKAGLSDKAILGKGMPCDVEPLNGKPLKMLTDVDLVDSYWPTKSAEQLADINDSFSYTNSERERKIIEAGKKIGIQFTFTGDYDTKQQILKRAATECE